MKLDDKRRLYAELHPLGTWLAPCKVTCECGYYAVATTCMEAQKMAWAHDAEHWAGRVGIAKQQDLFS